MIKASAPRLDENEELLLEVPDIRIRDIRFRVYLTQKRLILSAQRPYEKDSSDVPVPVMRSVRAGESDKGEPILILGIKAPNGSNRRITLTFSGGSGWNRASERDLLKDRIERCISQSQRNPAKTCDTGGARPIPQERPREPVKWQATPVPPATGDAEFITGRPRTTVPVHVPPVKKSTPRPLRSGGFERRRPALDLDFFGGRAPDTDTIPGTIAGFILSPAETFMATERKEPAETFPVLLICMAVFAFGSTVFLGIIASAAGASEYPALAGLADPGTAILVSVGILVLGLVLVFVNAYLLNLGASCAGMETETENTFRIAAYSAVPFGIGGLIPVFGVIIAPLWSLFLQFTGMRTVFPMKKEKAAIAVLVPATVFLVLLLVFAAAGADGFSILGGA